MDGKENLQDNYNGPIEYKPKNKEEKEAEKTFDKEILANEHKEK